MPSLNEIRQKYPEYNDMSDQEFADKFHDKFYSDIPKEDYYKKLQFEPKKEKSQFQETAEYLYKPGKFAGELGSGAAQELLNLPVKGVQAYNKLFNQSVTEPYSEFKFAPETKVAQMGGIMAPMAAGGIGGLAMKAPWMASFLSKVPGLSGALTAGGGAALGAATVPENPLLGLALGGTAAPALSAGAKHSSAVVNALRPTSITASLFPAKNLTNEQLLKNIEAAGETSTSLGNVLESPFLKRQYENVLSKVPLAGANEKMLSSANQTVEQGKGILNKLLGENNPEQVTQQVSDTLLKEFNKHQEEKSKLYNEVNELADKYNLKPDLSGFSSKAKEYMGAIESSNILKYEPDVARIFNKLGNYINPNKIETAPIRSDPITGQPILKIEYPTLKEANLLKGKLNEYAKKAGQSPDPSQRGLATVYGNLAKSLKSDIEKSIESSGNMEIKNSYRNAEENYKKSFSPFLDKEIYKHISGQKDPDMIVADFLKTSRSTDRSKKLSKLTNKLPDKERKLIGYSYFSNALDKEGNLNPQKLNSLIDNLGKKQLNVLINDESLRKELLNFSKLYKMNTKGIDLLKNPPTGQQAMDIIPGLLAHGGASYAGGLLGGLPGAIVGLAAPGLASKPLVNALTSPKFRQKTVNAILKKREMASKKGKSE